MSSFTPISVALCEEGVDRNNIGGNSSRGVPSPSAKRAWIEIVCTQSYKRCFVSPSAKRAWIEMSETGDIELAR